MSLIRRLSLCSLFLLILVPVTATAAGDIWTRIDASRVRRMATERDRRLPRAYAAFALDAAQLKVVLAQAPEEYRGESQTILELPMPDGTLSRFRIEHSLVVEPGLLDKFPELSETYRGYGIDDPTASVRFDILPNGFHAMVLRAGTTIYVDPYSNGNYLAYEKTAMPPPTDPFICHVGEEDITSRLRTEKIDIFRSAEAPEVTSGTTMRTYRLAVAANWEYCQAVAAGSTAACMAAQVVTMNRVNGVYERDVAIHMNIVANNNLIVFATDNTAACGGVSCTTSNDGYTNGNGSTMLGENATKLSTVIGSGNYDIGHVFSTGGGGVAQLGVPCGSSKARGVTGQGNPVGDPFDIDYVAHEMGHQWGGNHTFNGVVGNCTSNRNGSAAYEVGSGITIMAYAGICQTQDLAQHSIDTFHVKSLEEIVAYSQSGTGNNCAVPTATGNTPPSNVTVGGPYTVPIQTPFALTATATDANGDTLTYDWQEYDLGSSTTGVPNSDSDGSARPIFKPVLPKTSPTRYFPDLQYILNNANVPPSTFDCGRATPCLTGELLPTLTRTMNFQVVVRDNRANGGGINTATAQVVVTSLSGPMLVTAPNTNLSVTGGGPLTVTWQVANTTAAPVNAANVDILLSTDGGLTFPTVLAAATPNDGSQTVTLPNIATSSARIKIQGTGKIFFDISNTNFTITASSVTVGGRVFGVGGRGVKSAVVTITGPGVNQQVLTTSLGAFTFANIPAGQTYTITAANRRYTYTPQVIAINDNVSNIAFQPQ